MATRRLVEHARTRYFADGADATAPVNPAAAGRHGPRGFVYEQYTLALTSALLDAVFGDKPDRSITAGGPPLRQLLDDPAAGYLPGAALDPSSAGQYWLRSGIAGFAAAAAGRFYQPARYTDPFGNVTVLEHDERDLYVRASTDPLGNRTEITAFDLRTLSPVELADPNGNRTEIAQDVLGRVTAVAVKGKPVGAAGWEADDLGGRHDLAAA